MATSMRINKDTLETLRYQVLADSTLSDGQRDKDLSLIAHVQECISDGTFTVVDRLDTIRNAVEKVQKKKNVSLRKKLKAKSRKVRRNATEDTRSVRALDAFDEKFMYSSDDEVRRFAEGSGITDVYNETRRFDNEWN